MRKFSLLVFLLLASISFIPMFDTEKPLALATVKCVALIISIDDYSHLTPLANPVRDAKAAATLFRKHCIIFRLIW